MILYIDSSVFSCGNVGVVMWVWLQISVPSQVMCSLEFSDEISCQLLTWEYFYTGGHKGATPLDRAPKFSATLPDLKVSSLSPPPPQQQYCKSF